MKLFDNYPYLKGDGIFLKKITEEDAPALKALVSDKKVYEKLPAFLYERKYDDPLLTIRRLDEEMLLTGESLIMGIYCDADFCEDSRQKSPTTDVLVGIAEIYNYDENRSNASIGYRVRSSMWGRGIASKTTSLLIDYLFNEIGVDSITAHVLDENKTSARVLAKNGFVDLYDDLWEDWGFDELLLTDKYILRKDWLTKDGEREDLADTSVEQFVMAYRVDQDRIRAMLPDGFTSLRPVLRINTEIRNDKILYVELNTPVEADGRRGWLNIDNWKSTHCDNMRFIRSKSPKNANESDSNESYSTVESDGSAEQNDRVDIVSPFLALSYTGAGKFGGCPAEKDNEGCYYLEGDTEFRPAEKIDQPKEFCDCEFAWSFNEGDAHGKSEGRTIPAHDTPVANHYERCELTAANAASIQCEQVLGAYIVRFTRKCVILPLQK